MMPTLLHVYPPRVVATLLHGGPRLVERMLEDTAAHGTPAHAPAPATLAHLAQQQQPVQLDAKVGDCTPTEPPPLSSQPSSRLLRAMARGGWTADGPADASWLGDGADEEEEEEEEEAAAAAAAKKAATPQRRPTLRTHPRGSPPPRDTARAGKKRPSRR
jgi:hypothetical protein